MNNLIIGDGAMGTELRRRGVKVPSHVESIWSALALKEATSTICLLYTSPSPRDGLLSRMPSSA